jgi:hypothetical protein
VTFSQEELQMRYLISCVGHDKYNSDIYIYIYIYIYIASLVLHEVRKWWQPCGFEWSVLVAMSHGEGGGGYDTGTGKFGLGQLHVVLAAQKADLPCRAGGC